MMGSGSKFELYKYLLTPDAQRLTPFKTPNYFRLTQPM